MKIDIYNGIETLKNNINLIEIQNYKWYNNMGGMKMFNRIKDDFDENMDDIMNSINKIINNEDKEKEEDKKDKE